MVVHLKIEVRLDLLTVVKIVAFLVSFFCI